MLRDFVKLFVDDSCYGCGKDLTSQESHVCLSCLSQIPHTGFHTAPAANELYERIAGKVALEGATALFYFDKQGRLQKLIKALKYKDAPQLGIYLGELLGREVAESAFIQEVEAIIPIPLHKSKMISRGYNQAAKIAEGLAGVLDIPLKTGCIRRSRKTLTQTRKSGEQRWANVSGAFSVQETVPKRVLLVDDVVTTGATLEACIAALMQSDHPPEWIGAAAIGMARKH